MDDVYTGEPKEKTSWWVWVVMIISFIGFFVIILSLPEDMQSSFTGFMDWFDPIADLFILLLLFASGLHCFWTSRKKPENGNQ